MNATTITLSITDTTTVSATSLLPKQYWNSYYTDSINTKTDKRATKKRTKSTS